MSRAMRMTCFGVILVSYMCLRVGGRQTDAIFLQSYTAQNQKRPAVQLQAAFYFVKCILLGSVDYANYHQRSLKKKKEHYENQVSPVLWRDLANSFCNASTPAWFLKGSHCDHGDLSQAWIGAVLAMWLTN